jgi:hypothetical protein
MSVSRPNKRAEQRAERLAIMQAWAEREIIRWIGPGTPTLDELMHNYRDGPRIGPAVSRAAMAEAIVRLAEGGWIVFAEQKDLFGQSSRCTWRLSQRGKALRRLSSEIADGDFNSYRWQAAKRRAWEAVAMPEGET